LDDNGRGDPEIPNQKPRRWYGASAIINSRCAGEPATIYVIPNDGVNTGGKIVKIQGSTVYGGDRWQSVGISFNYLYI
jgi:hypothetical protein